jgi:hypothetical protein
MSSHFHSKDDHWSSCHWARFNLVPQEKKTGKKKAASEQD